MNLLERVRREPPHFADDVIRAPEMAENEYMEFASSVYWCDSHSINIHDVTGTYHPDYQGMTWGELLEKGKRMRVNLRLLEEKPEYYDSRDRKIPAMYFLKVDDKVYVAGDGNHRTCIAKMLFYYDNRIFLHGVTLREIVIDREAMAACERLRSALPPHMSVNPVRTCLTRQDGAGWHRETWDVHLDVRDHRKGTEVRLDAVDADGFIRKQQGLRAWLLSLLAG